MKTSNNISFDNSHFFVGVDTHLKNWKVTVRFNSIELKTFSMNPAPLELVKYLKKNYPGGIYHIVYEAGFWAFRDFRKLDIDCIIVNPADVPTSNKEKVNKNDPIDSRKLARELENGSLKSIYVPDIFHEELRHLMRLRYRIIQNQTRTKNRIKALLHTQGIHIPIHFTGNSRWSASFIKWLLNINLNTPAGQFTLENLILQLQQLRENNKNILSQLRLQAKQNNIAPVINALLSVPGVGFITAMTLYTEIVDMKRFSNQNRLAAFVGLVPSIRSSDDNIYNNGISFRKNKFLRPIMIEAAWTAVKTDPAMTLRYRELTNRMKPKLAIIKIAKKLLKRIRHVWIKQEDYVYSLVA